MTTSDSTTTAPDWTFDMLPYRTTISDTPLEMPADESYHATLDEALRYALGTAVSPVGGSDPWETVTISRETGDDTGTTRTYTLQWSGVFSDEITTTVTIKRH